MSAERAEAQRLLLNRAAQHLELAVKELPDRPTIHLFALWALRTTPEDGVVEGILAQEKHVRSYTRVAALGYAVALGELSLSAVMREELLWLLERPLRIEGSPAGFCVDPVALLGIFLACLALQDEVDLDLAKWSGQVLSVSQQSQASDWWSELLAHVARGLGEPIDLREEASNADVRLALHDRDLVRRTPVQRATDEVTVVAQLCANPVEELGPVRGLLRLGVIRAVEADGAPPSLTADETEEAGSMDDRCDTAIIIALREEFQELREQIQQDARSEFDPRTSQYYYRFSRPCAKARDYDCVATFVGAMGPTNAAYVAGEMIRRYQPAAIINVGIAGGVSGDVRVGDVVVADQIDEYLAGSKATRSGASQELQLSGTVHRACPQHLSHIRNLEFAHSHQKQAWESSCVSSLERLVDQATALDLVKRGLISKVPAYEVGHLASGPVVAGTVDFVAWLKKRDRKYLAIEMEAAGVVLAGFSTGTPTVVLRGISDLADSRKADLDAVGGGALRRYAMRNALHLLWGLMSSGIVARPEARPAVESRT
ncbi:MAG TPA: hypothetical protein DEA08_28905 [Planctomycetes bacterium]|nr:hypothetical protein [Planctomycetota bacterium]